MAHFFARSSKKKLNKEEERKNLADGKQWAKYEFYVFVLTWSSYHKKFHCFSKKKTLDTQTYTHTFVCRCQLNLVVYLAPYISISRALALFVFSFLFEVSTETERNERERWRNTKKEWDELQFGLVTHHKAICSDRALHLFCRDFLQRIFFPIFCHQYQLHRLECLCGIILSLKYMQFNDHIILLTMCDVLDAPLGGSVRFTNINFKILYVWGDHLKWYLIV